MIKRVLALLLAAVVLAGCASSESASEPVEYEIGSAEEYSPTVVTDVVKDGVLQLQPLKGANFTMDYEPRKDSFIVNHFGLDFIFPYDTNWLGDEGLKAKFDINKNGTDVYGTVDITTAPKNIQEYYGTTDTDAIGKKVMEEFLTAEAYYNQTREKLTAAGFEIVKEGCGKAFAETDIWKAFYIEYMDSEKGTCSMRFYLCNDEINEKFYSFEVKVDVPKDETETADMLRSVIFSLKAMADGKIVSTK